MGEVVSATSAREFVTSEKMFEIFAISPLNYSINPRINFNLSNVSRSEIATKNLIQNLS